MKLKIKNEIKNKNIFCLTETRNYYVAFQYYSFYLFAVVEAISEPYQRNKPIDIQDYQEKLRIFIKLFKPLYNDTPLDKPEILVNFCFPMQ